ncbi:MAG: CarD family transcriptional regulator [Actinomycetota bacterium]|nr:CarD family transcriptional regulator [Actinomycetota bacterium]
MFNVGDKVVYPHHGAGVVERIEERDVEGEKKKFFILSLCGGDLKITVPEESTEDVGLRSVIPRQQMKSVLEVLNQGQSQMPTNWNHRYKKNRDKISSGDVYQVAEVVRNLSIRERERGLSTGEKRMLNQARQILLSEVIYVLNIEPDRASKMLDDVLFGD